MIAGNGKATLRINQADDESRLLFLTSDLEAAKSSGIETSILHTHYEMGILYRQLKQPEKAIRHLLNVSGYELSGVDMDSFSYYQIMEAHIRIAGIFRDYEFFDKAQSFLKSGLQSAQAEMDSVLVGRFLAHQVFAYQTAKEYDSGILVSNKQLKFHSKIDRKRLRVLNELGFSFSWLDRKEKTNEYYSQLLREAFLIGDLENVATAKHSLADMAYRKGRHDQAYKMFKESLDLKLTIDDRFGLYSTYRDISKISSDSGNYHFAVKYLKLAEKVLTPKDYKAHEYIYRLLAENYQAMGKIDEANRYNTLRQDVLRDLDDGKRHVNYITRQNERRAIVDGYYLELESKRVQARTHRVMIATIILLTVMLLLSITYTLIRRYRFNNQLNQALEILKWEND